MYVCVYVCNVMYACMRVVSVCVYVCNVMYVCVCMYVCMYVCMHVCMQCWHRKIGELVFILHNTKDDLPFKKIFTFENQFQRDCTSTNDRLFVWLT